MAKKNAKSTLSVAEFRSWLEGVEDMQGDEWSPNLEQWKKIRAKIELLEEISYDELLEDVISKVGTVSKTAAHTPAHSFRQPVYEPGSSSLDVPDGINGPKMITTMPPIPPSSALGAEKTPNSEGPYQSQFL